MPSLRFFRCGCFCHRLRRGAMAPAHVHLLLQCYTQARRGYSPGYALRGVIKVASRELWLRGFVEVTYPDGTDDHPLLRITDAGRRATDRICRAAGGGPLA